MKSTERSGRRDGPSCSSPSKIQDRKKEARADNQQTPMAAAVTIRQVV